MTQNQYHIIKLSSWIFFWQNGSSFLLKLWHVHDVKIYYLDTLFLVAHVCFYFPIYLVSKEYNLSLGYQKLLVVCGNHMKNHNVKVLSPLHSVGSMISHMVLFIFNSLFEHSLQWILLLWLQHSFSSCFKQKHRAASYWL